MSRVASALLLALALTAVIPAAPLPPAGVRGDQFVTGDQAFRFVGANVRGISHYGEGDVLPFTNSAHRSENLDAVANMDGLVIRTFLPIPDPSRTAGTAATEELIARLGVTLDACEQRGIRAIVALTDFYAASGFRVPGDDAYYTDNGAGFVVLNDAWFAGGYQDNYLPWVEDVVSAHANHSAVFAWEIGNELTDAFGTNNILAFATDVAATIRAHDPDTLIAFGGLGVEHFDFGGELGRAVEFYDILDIDFVTIHIFDGNVSDDTFRVAWALEKPIVVEETGNSLAMFPDRPGALTAQMADWIDAREARGILQWGFQSQNVDIGDGDLLYGMDPNAFVSDWAAMNAAYQNRAFLFGYNAITVPPIALPAGDNLALTATDWATSSDFSAAFDGSKAIDGVIAPDSKWTSDGSTSTSWLALDLGQLSGITGAVVRSAGAGYETPIYNLTALQIQVGPSLSGPWTTHFTFSDNHPRNRAVCLFDEPVFARFVRLLVTDAGVDNYARVPEFEVYGIAWTGPPPSGLSLD